MKKQNIKQIALCALFTAVIAASAWLSVPTPFGINLAFTVFGVSLAGFCLGARGAVASTAVYIIIGAVGVPVYSYFTGGIGVLLGPSGGFLWGFIAVALLCGLANRASKRYLKIILMLLSVLLCHSAGVVQYSVVSGVNLWAGFVTASLPFIVKDFVIVFLAEIIAKKLKNKIKI